MTLGEGVGVGLGEGCGAGTGAAARFWGPGTAWRNQSARLSLVSIVLPPNPPG
jgi:hypothetical protein